MPDPILDQTSLLRPQEGGALVNPDIADEVAQAGAAIGQAVQGLGEEGFQVSLAIQGRKNAGELANLRREMRSLYAEGEREMLKNPDADHVEKWEETLNRYSSDVTARELPPAVREEFQEMYANFAATTMDRVKEMRLEHDLEKSLAQQTEAADAALNMDDLPAALEEIDAIEGLPDFEKDKIKRKLTQRFDYNNLESIAEVDPTAIYELAATDQLPGDLSKADMDRIRGIADRSFARLKAEEADFIAQRAESGQVKTESDVDDALEEALYLDKEEKAKFKSSLLEEAEVPIEEGERFGLRDKIKDLRKRSDQYQSRGYETDYLQLIQELSIYGNRPGARDLREELAAISPDSIAHIKQVGIANRKQHYASIGGDIISDLHNALPNKETKSTVRGDAERAFSTWLQTHPDPDSLEEDAVKAKAKEFWQGAYRGVPMDEIIWEDSTDLAGGGPGVLPPKR